MTNCCMVMRLCIQFSLFAKRCLLIRNEYIAGISLILSAAMFQVSCQEVSCLRFQSLWNHFKTGS